MFVIVNGVCVCVFLSFSFHSGSILAEKNAAYMQLLGDKINHTQWKTNNVDTTHLTYSSYNWFCMTLIYICIVMVVCDVCLVSSQFKILFWLKYERKMFILDITTIRWSASEMNHTEDHSVKRNEIDCMMLTMQCTHT